MFNGLNKYVSQILYGNPSKSTFTISVVGSDNLASTASTIFEIVQRNIGKCSLYTDQNTRIGLDYTGKTGKYSHYDTQDFLAKSKLAGCQISIFSFNKKDIIVGLDENINPDIVVLTGISDQDIADSELFLKSMKMVFSNDKANKMAVLPKDDRLGAKRYSDISRSKNINFGITTSASVQATNIEFFGDTIGMDIIYLGKSYYTSIVGNSNNDVYSKIAGISACCLLGIDVADCL